MIMRRLHDERGVAAITVLMVIVTLALAGGVVAFTAITELEIGGRERRAEDAFVSAEAGLDMAAAYFQRNPTFTGGVTQVCINNPLMVDTPDIPCEVDITSPSNGLFVYPPTGKPFIEYTVISQAREGTAVTRTLGASYRLIAREIPFGMFVNGNVDLNGTPNLLRESLLVNGVVTSREKLDMDWNTNNQFDDPDLGWRFHKDRILSNPVPDMCLDTGSGEMVGCAGVFSNFQIFQKNQQKASDEIHVNSPSPYPRDRDSHQAAVNGLGEPQPVVTLPTTDVLEAMDTLKTLAQAQGNYFNFKDGSGGTTILQPGDIGAPAKDFAKNAVFYIDADAGDTIGWKSTLIPDSTSSDILYTNSSGQRVGSLSGILVVRGGILRLESGDQWSGAIFVPENQFRILGNVSCTCTIYAQGFSSQGGGSQIDLTPDWFTNLPAGLMTITREVFVECEPFQPSAVCP
jgi:hypothetical protein